ncbi:hypothetical protein [Herbidospora mongoliensis]|uniref:hypothetical protein n=1 Tax=Herbidospora mongoliensis TaxID=688067 RepID=UPI000AE5DBB3|nr:hypothetical protein [Herbidospora mongoliensis]
MGKLLRGTAAFVAFLAAAGPAAAHAEAPSGQWGIIRDAPRDSYDAVTVTPGGGVWVAGTRGTESLLLKGRTTFKRVAGPGFRVKKLASASDTRVWAFGASRYARWDGKRWQVKRWTHGRVDQAYSIGKNLWVIENANTFSAASGAGWKATSTLRRLVGSTWRKVPTPIVVKGLDGRWAAGSVRGKAALARWSGTAWRTYALPAVPVAHPGQVSELTDVAVDGETGRVMAVGWVAWPCGGAKYCGETLLLTGPLSEPTLEVRSGLGVQPSAQAVPDERGGAWVVPNPKSGGLLHIRTESVEPGVLPAPKNRKASVRGIAIWPENGSLWAVGSAIWARRP